MSLLFAKDLYRRLDRVLGDVHRRVRGQQFLQEALYKVFDAHGRELRASGAQLFAHGSDGSLLESVARVGNMEGVGSAPLALADFHAHFDPSGERVRLIAGGEEAAQPLAWFEVAHGERPFVFLFHLEDDWDRGAAELLLNTACSILSVCLADPAGIGSVASAPAPVPGLGEVRAFGPPIAT